MEGWREGRVEGRELLGDGGTRDGEGRDEVDRGGREDGGK